MAIQADRVQAVQLPQNLIGDALKFSREGIPSNVGIYPRIGAGQKSAMRSVLRTTV